MLDRIAHAVGAGDLAGMGRDPQPRVAGDGEGIGKIRRGPDPFIPAHAETGDGPVRPQGGKTGDVDCVVLVEMSDAGNDLPALDAVFVPRPLNALSKPVDIGLGRQAGAPGMIR